MEVLREIQPPGWLLVVASETSGNFPIPNAPWDERNNLPIDLPINLSQMYR